MNYTLLKQLIEQAEAFEQDAPAENQQTLARFSAWLHKRHASAPAQMPPDDPASPLVAGTHTPDSEIAALVSCLYRYAKLYSKKALAGTPIGTIDEFAYLVILLHGTEPTKTEIIEQNIHEKTTGTEILRRLISGGLIEQFDDSTDRRSKRLRLSDSGIALMGRILPRMDQVATLIGGELTTSEKTELVALLTKLHLFHNQIFMNERDIQIPELVERLSMTSRV